MLLKRYLIRKKRIIFVIFAVAAVFFSVVFIKISSFSKWEQRIVLDHWKNLDARIKYHKRFNRTMALLKDLESQKYFLRLKNTEKNKLFLKHLPFFLTKEKLARELHVQIGESEEDVLKRIHDFVQIKRKSRRPLYCSPELHDPEYFFSVYGCGYCDDVAQNFALLVDSFGYKTKIHGLEGHVVPSVYYDSDWRVYDPDTLGITKFNGKVASFEQMVHLADQGALLTYNAEFRTRYDNSAFNPSRRSNVPFYGWSILIDEEFFFFENSYMLSSDGSYLPKLNIPCWFPLYYGGVLANFVRKIPIAISEDEDSMTFSSEFPISGIFIQVPENVFGSFSINDMPVIDIDSDRFKEKKAIPFYRGSIVRNDNLKNIYIDMTPALRNLESYPSHRVRIHHMKHLSLIKNVSLVTVHPYCIRNADFSYKNLESVGAQGLKWQFQSEYFKRN